MTNPLNGLLRLLAGDDEALKRLLRLLGPLARRVLHLAAVLPRDLAARDGHGFGWPRDCAG